MFSYTSERHFDHLYASFGEIRECIAYVFNITLYGINFDERVSGSRIILKGLQDGQGVIAYITASTLDRCLAVLKSFVHARTAKIVEWRKDKYYKAPQNDYVKRFDEKYPAR